MTNAAGTAGTFGRDARIIGWVSVAHTLSHFYQLVLPPFFPVIAKSFDLSYAALGLMLTVLYAVSGLAQTPAGFIVDRFGPRRVIIVGLVLMAGGAFLASFANGLPMLLLSAVLAGLGNSVFHPADLALLNRHVSRERLGYAFSAHNVGGSLGWVCAPLLAATLGELVGWRMAVAAAAGFGLVFALLFALQGVLDESAAKAPERSVKESSASSTDVRLLSMPILLCFAFFMLQSIAYSALTTFSPTAFVQLYDMPLLAASSLLTAFLIGGIVGTLGGGVLAARSRSHNRVASGSIFVAAVLIGVVALGWVPSIMLWMLFAAAGAMAGCANPARDILVGELAPAKVRGKVYGFVYSGLDAGAALAPPLLGWFIDRGWPAMIFGTASLALLLAIPTLWTFTRRSP